MDNSKKTSEKKQYKLKPTVRQRRLARLIIDSATGKLNVKSNKELIKLAGYSDTLQNCPDLAFGKAGVQSALEEEGFTTDNAKRVVQKIMNSETAKDKDKLKAADLVFKVNGDYASDKIARENSANPIIFAKIEQHIYQFENELKKALGYETTGVISEIVKEG